MFASVSRQKTERRRIIQQYMFSEGRSTFLFLHKLLESLFRRLSRIKSGRHQGTKATSTRVRGSRSCLDGTLRIVPWWKHSSASCSKTRTRMEAEFEVRPSRVRSSHKLASCRGRQHSWTAPIWILKAWTRANLAQPDGKCRERATAPIPLPGVEACGPVLSFGLSNTLSFVPSRALACPYATKSRKVLREFAPACTMLHT